MNRALSRPAVTALWLLLALPPVRPARADEPAAVARRLAALVELAAQEYRLGFAGGEIARPEEIAEARALAGQALSVARDLPHGVAALIADDLAALGRLVRETAPADSVSARSALIRRRLAERLRIALEPPARIPSLAAGERVYRERCASCHGLAGAGDGPAGSSLRPPPADLADRAALEGSTLRDFYRKLTFGVPRTGMPAFEGLLGEQARWDVAAYATGLRARGDGLAVAASASSLSGCDGCRAVQVARLAIKGALGRAAGGDPDGAALAASDGYLVFESVEAEVRAKSPGLAARTEAAFSAFRAAAASAGAAAGAGAALDAELGPLSAAVLASLEEVEAALAEQPARGALFIQSLLLIVREGFEAILIVGVIMAVAVQSGGPARKREVRWGIALAVAASLGTAVLLESLFRAAPARREALEGLVMLAAAGMLFYVSYWLISKLEATAWQRFVRRKLDRALASGGAAALAAVAFTAVYREGFEVVLFYRALLGTAGPDGAGAVGAGLLIGLVLLGALYLGIERFGLKVPLRPFFTLTGTLLYLLAFTFAGRGVSELQESGLIPLTPVAGGLRVPWLGIYPTAESLALQALIAALLVAALVWIFAVRPATAPVRRRAPSSPS